ncbi:MAG TPA: hypothetical protein VFU03_00490, partial [Gemmatimonadales bacterium]|nr:hypothetical protein [Gemmatimonadales bacterium]
ADDPAIWRETIPRDIRGERQTITLRHPTYPFLRQWSRRDTESLKAIAAQYLDKVSTTFGLPANLFDPNSSNFKKEPLRSGFPLTWLGIGLDENLSGPRTSFWIRHHGTLPRDPTVRDRTAIMLAVQAFTANDPRTALGSRLGIRIVMQVAPSGEVRITGSTCSADLARTSGPHTEAVRIFLKDFFDSPKRRSDVKDAIARAAGEDSDKLWLDGLRVRTGEKRSPLIEVYANVQRRADTVTGSAYAVTATPVLLPGDIPKLDFQILEKSPLIAHATPVIAKLFPHEPASQAGVGHLAEGRPNRAPDYRTLDELERFRSWITLPGLTLDSSLETHLLDDLDQEEVMQSTLVDPTANEDQDQVVDQPSMVQHARTNEFAALSGSQHARELFDTMRLYGIDPVLYFRFAAFPLHVRFRAGIIPGPGKDGKTVNAMVDYDPPRTNYNDEPDPKVLQPLQVRFALADLKRSPSRREPLGLAADPRWSWHEYSHVLLAASSGALELRFVHSAGDALAAILWDPPSALAGDAPPVTPPPPPPTAGPDALRMATFPWVYLNRRHDRSVYAGWSWCGTYHRAYAFAPLTGLRRRKGYKSEQILSTSLFRVYRVLGGDTVKSAGLLKRWAAADYTAYLIMRALAWVGPISGAPPETPDQLVSALTDADVGTTTWPVPQRDPTWPPRVRVGGCAHKVVRWAFEAQGLYASTSDPLKVVDAPGSPPDIDIYIDNGRPDSEGAYPRGGYMPVSLDWNPPPNGSRWLATDEAIKVVGGTQVFVAVGNRGPSPASDVVVQVWYKTWPTAQPDPPDWDPTPAVWTSLGTYGPTSVPGGVEVSFGPFASLPTTPAGSRLLIFAQATCTGDRASSDPVTGLPCSAQPTSIVDLVVGDNNLGLKLYMIP